MVKEYAEEEGVSINQAAEELVEQMQMFGGQSVIAERTQEKLEDQEEKKEHKEMEASGESESPSIIIACSEAVPPQAPDGLEFYLLQSGQLSLEWEFPYNPTEDIKRFQIFRRSSIYEPFTLLKQLDFDNSVVKTRRTEDIPRFSNIELSSPQVYFVDEEWSIGDKYIYAVSAVDAHDLGSGYSEQFEVSFDMFQAQLEIDFIAGKDAPKPYPNFTLVTPLTEDSIKDSNHSALTCYFDPEYLKVLNSSGEDMQHLASSLDNPSYKLQLLHLNFQQSAVIDINVKD